jgi:hypothetical protein
MRCRRRSFSLESALNRARALGRRRPFGRLAVTTSVGALGAAARSFGGFPLLWRRQIDPRPPCLGQSNGDGLLGRPRAVLPFPDMVDFLPYKLAGLRRWRFSRTLVRAGAFDRLFLWHVFPLCMRAIHSLK